MGLFRGVLLVLLVVGCKSEKKVVIPESEVAFAENAQHETTLAEFQVSACGCDSEHCIEQVAEGFRTYLEENDIEESVTERFEQGINKCMETQKRNNYFLPFDNWVNSACLCKTRKCIIQVQEQLPEMRRQLEEFSPPSEKDGRVAKLKLKQGAACIHKTSQVLAQDSVGR